MHIEDKLSILADAAKYDVSCASSGSRRENTDRRLGNTVPGGICHSYTEDGRCVSLLKILYTNFCIYDCAYCVNRSGNDIPRAAFTPREIVSLTMEFYRRNYIEGLFLSSGVLQSPDDTMERLVRTAQDLRKQGFNGYIHLKCVPFASRRLICHAGRVADRLSVNIELPSEKSLKRLTRDKTYDSILAPMGTIQEKITETKEDRKRLRHVPAFSPGGQSTQLIVGASPESDYEILSLSDRLYRQKALKRVYYSAYVPVGPATARLPDIEKPPLVRENRLYQADWLMRLYGFSIDEVISSRSPYLDLKNDPKQAFALQHPELFPVDINAADRESILRVPGIGLKSADRILTLRLRGRIRYEHLKPVGVVVSRALTYLYCDGLPTNHWQGTALSHPVKVPGISRPQKASSETGAQNIRLVFVPDDTFEGLLTAIFEAYAGKCLPDVVESRDGHQLGLFERRVAIKTDPNKSERVWKGLKIHLGSGQRRQIYEAYLSQIPGVKTAICRFVFDTIPGRRSRQGSVHLAAHIRIEKLAQSVRREAHRMQGFIRFKHMGHGQYLALIAPRYDVLPLIRRHFESRFADQAWIIYDTARDYGLFFDRCQTCEVKLDVTALKTSGEDDSVTEQRCQTLWKRYYAAVNVSQRNNPKQQLQQLPRRYWRYLTEKQP